ncbi:MAG: S8 family serine peptidase [Nitriliruptorales bacterium]|nr:S8 family serine peptidase [Nitriliruptorales bacterium]
MTRRAPITLLVLCLAALTALAVPATAHPPDPEPAPASQGESPDIAVGMIIRGSDGLEVVRTRAPSVAAARQRLRALSGELGPVLAADAEVTLRTLQQEPERERQWALDTLEAERAWTITQGDGVVIGVLDSGADPGHPDLREALVPGVDLLDPSTQGLVDPNGHGTAVASVAGARLNGIGMAGLAPSASIMPLRVVNQEGLATSTDAAEGVIWAADHGADVVNISLGVAHSSAVLATAIDYAVDAGVTVVAAAGNYGTEGNPVTYPAALPNVIGVSATDASDAPATFSNSGDWVDLAAPGTDLVTATAGGGWSLASGTSLSAPLVSASAALLRAQTPGLDPATIRSTLLETATDVHTPGRDPQTGEGLVSPANALSASPAVPGLVPALLDRVGADPVSDPTR